MNTNFSLGNQRVAELKAQKNMYMSHLKKQQMMINALQHNVFRQQSSVHVPAPAPAPAPAHHDVHHNNVHIKKGFNALLKKMNSSN